jgi:glutathione S-transferase
MKLLGTHRSPYVRKVRIVLEEKRIPYDFVIAPPTDPKSGVSKHNPLGKIPVLVCDDGNSIYDSSVIVEYLDGIGRSPNLIPDGLIFLARHQTITPPAALRAGLHVIFRSLMTLGFFS